MALGVVVALALSVAGAVSASAQGLALKANGEAIPSGALVNLATAEKPEYSFKTKVTVQGSTAPAAEEVECESYLEQGTLEHNTETGTWSLVETHPVEICEGSWFTESLIENRITLASPNVATDESLIELMRSAEEVRAEERKQTENGEPVSAREPLHCQYTATATGTFTTTTKKPMLIKVHGSATLHPVSHGTGCSSKAKLKGAFTMTYKGQPVYASSE